MIALSPTPVLETTRLILRAPQGGDYEPWAAFATSDRARYIGGPHDRQGAWRAWGHAIGHWAMRGYGMFVFAYKTAPDAPLGMTGACYPEGWPELEVGWWLLPASQGQGYATEAARRARLYAYQTLGVSSLVSYIHPDNTPSKRVAERLGASFEKNIPLRGIQACVYRHPPASAISA